MSAGLFDLFDDRFIVCWIPCKKSNGVGFGEFERYGAACEDDVNICCEVQSAEKGIPVPAPTPATTL